LLPFGLPFPLLPKGADYAPSSIFIYLLYYLTLFLLPLGLPFPLFISPVNAILSSIGGYLS
jgi:hypothetical protein